MNRAFIFDMDGVIVDSERGWHRYGAAFHASLFGKEVLPKMGVITGLSIDTEYELAQKYGFSMDIQEYYSRYDKKAFEIYDKSNITKNLAELLKVLHSLHFKIGLVSASRRSWIEKVFARLPHTDYFDYVISLNDRPDLKHKPNPDGYNEAMKKLNVVPEQTIILEDSNSGIQAAKASGAFTIGYTENLVPNYIQSGADVYAGSMNEIITIVKQFS